MCYSKSSYYHSLTKYFWIPQTCRLVYGNGMFDTSRISLLSSSDAIYLDGYRENPLWEPLTTSAVKHTRVLECCAEVYEDITYSVTVRRREDHGLIISAVGMDDGMHGSMHPSHVLKGRGGRAHLSPPSLIQGKKKYRYRIFLHIITVII